MKKALTVMISIPALVIGALAAAAVILLCILAVCSTLRGSDMMRDFGINEKSYTVISETDTYGGFPADGWTFIVLDCSSNRDKAMQEISGWKRLPMSENLSIVMYGGKKNGINYYSGLVDKAGMPHVENGYYQFKDRRRDAEDESSDEGLLDRYSTNFSLIVYDCDTDRMYYFREDT